MKNSPFGKRNVFSAKYTDRLSGMNAQERSINFCFVFLPEKDALVERYIKPAAPSVIRVNIIIAHMFRQ
ncbi:MAG: hypothetical protein Q8O41_06350 [Candidatus Methanoperedens sp.]|nr:hypothetical protein [Candidatus Methanoperedens sp.]